MPHVVPASAPVALVTGASRGIGAAIASALARAGFRVALTARNEVRLTAKAQAIEEAGGIATAISADLHDPKAADTILAAVERSFGPPQVIVNNAGTAPSERFELTADDDLDAVLDLHVKAPFRLIRAALPSLREIPGSCVVQLASTAGLVGFPFTAAYTAAKHGMVGMSRALSAELREKPPRVYAVCPGFVDTEITHRAADHIAKRGKQTADEAMLALGAMNRIGRMHTAEEVGETVCRLIQEQPPGCVFDMDRDPPAFV